LKTAKKPNGNINGISSGTQQDCDSKGYQIQNKRTSEVLDESRQCIACLADADPF
jgi:hypothetical protein